MTADRTTIFTLSFVLREKPISINEAYSTSRGRRFLTSEGRAFESRMTAAASEAIVKSQMSQLVGWNRVVDSIYKNGGGIHLMIHLYLSDLYNGKWKVGGNETDKGERRSPYKKLDASNYIKLIEDAIVKGTGIDDSCHLFTGIEKHHDSDDPRIEVVYTVLE